MNLCEFCSLCRRNSLVVDELSCSVNSKSAQCSFSFSWFSLWLKSLSVELTTSSLSSSVAVAAAATSSASLLSLSLCYSLHTLLHYWIYLTLWKDARPCVCCVSFVSPLFVAPHVRPTARILIKFTCVNPMLSLRIYTRATAAAAAAVAVLFLFFSQPPGKNPVLRSFLC